MSALAGILLDAGAPVSGCDLSLNDATRELAARGARIYEGHDPLHLRGVGKVVITGPAGRTAEVARARELGLPVVKRAQFLGELMDARRGVAVAGTHGKTTTTSLLAVMLVEGGLDPTVVVGGVPAGWRSGGRQGAGEWLLAEADEYDRSFLHLRPEVTVLTGVDWDHPDIYPSIEAVEEAFERYLGGLREGGVALVYAGSPRALSLARRVAPVRRLRVETYGSQPEADWRLVASGREGGRSRFEVHRGDERLEGLELALPGRHNLENAVGAAAAARALGVAPAAIRDALRGFRGVARRFELKGEAAGATVIDDYAHNPEKLEAAIRAAREAYPLSRVWVAFQPHTYSRTKALWGEFVAALRLADRAYVLDVYAAREEPDSEVSAERLASEVGERGVYAGSVAEAPARIAPDLAPGVLLMTIGAGDITHVGPALLDLLTARPPD
jgi:UDP-N-acetylmuramate--alanine ligase